MQSNSLFRKWSAALLVCGAAFVLGAQAQSDPGLERILDVMDKTAANFRSAEANLVVELYTSAVHETDEQTGKVYFRRRGSDLQMGLDMSDPKAPKYVLLSAGKLQLFEPTLDRVTVYDVGKNQDEYEAFLCLGFGGGGHAMQKSFELKYMGSEKVAGNDAAKLDMVPKNPKVLNMFPHIVLWIDPARGVAVQQQLFEPGGEDYRLSKYSDIQLNHKMSDSVFKLKTDGKTTFRSVSPHD